MGELTLSFKISELKDKLAANREKHEETYRKAMDGYRKAVETELRAKLDRINNRKSIKRHLDNVEPEHHLDEYDAVIEMLALTSDSQIELSQSQFQQYVMDEWNWKQQFTASTSSYL